MSVKYRIREHVLVHNHHGNRWELWRGLFPPGAQVPPEHLQSITISTESKQETKLIELLLLSTGITLDDLSKTTGMSLDKILDVIHALEKYDLIEKFDDQFKLTAFDQERYGRQLRLFSLFGSAYEIQDKIREATVVVVGLGGIGGWLIYNLVSIGIGKIIGFDHDVVEISNLNRQILYAEDDVGRLKAVVAEERLRKYNSGITIEMHPSAITADNVADSIPPDANVVVSTAFPVEYYVNAFCVSHNISVLAQGGGAYSPTGVILMIPYQTGCFACVENPIPAWNDLAERVRARHGRDYALTTTFSPFVSLCANMMAVEIFKLITGIGEPIHNMIIDPLTWTIKMGVFSPYRQPDCPICGRKGSIS